MSNEKSHVCLQYGMIYYPCYMGRWLYNKPLYKDPLGQNFWGICRRFSSQSANPEKVDVPCSSQRDTLPETNSSPMKIPIFPGFLPSKWWFISHGFLLVSWRVQYTVFASWVWMIWIRMFFGGSGIPSHVGFSQHRQLKSCCSREAYIYIP